MRSQRVFILMLAAVGGQLPSGFAAPATTVARLDRSVQVGGGPDRPLEALLGTLAARVGFPCILDPSVPTARRLQPIPFELHHTTGYEALAALARTAALEVVVLGRSAMLVPPEEMPTAWQALSAHQQRESDLAREAAGRGWSRLLARRARMTAVDVTFAAALAHVRSAYQIDVLAPNEIWREQTLITIQGDTLTLRAALDQLAAQLNVQVRCGGGVAWLTRLAPSDPRRGDPLGGRVRAPAIRRPAAPIPAPPRSRLTRRVRLQPVRRTRDEFLTAAGQATAVVIEAPSQRNVAGRSPEAVAVEGELGDVLEAVRLMWKREWRVIEDPAGPTWTIVLSSSYPP